MNLIRISQKGFYKKGFIQKKIFLRGLLCSIRKNAAFNLELYSELSRLELSISTHIVYINPHKPIPQKIVLKK